MSDISNGLVPNFTVSVPITPFLNRIPFPVGQFFSSLIVQFISFFRQSALRKLELC